MRCLRCMKGRTARLGGSVPTQAQRISNATSPSGNAKAARPGHLQRKQQRIRNARERRILHCNQWFQHKQRKQRKFRGLPRRRHGGCGSEMGSRGAIPVKHRGLDRSHGVERAVSRGSSRRLANMRVARPQFPCSFLFRVWFRSPHGVPHDRNYGANDGCRVRGTLGLQCFLRSPLAPSRQIGHARRDGASS